MIPVRVIVVGTVTVMTSWDVPEVESQWVMVIVAGVRQVVMNSVVVVLVITVVLAQAAKVEPNKDERTATDVNCIVASDDSR